jgi:hypothetical protein
MKFINKSYCTYILWGEECIRHILGKENRACECPRLFHHVYNLNVQCAAIRLNKEKTSAFSKIVWEPPLCSQRLCIVKLPYRK